MTDMDTTTIREASADLGALSGRLQAAVRAGVCSRRGAQQAFFTALEAAASGRAAAAMDLLGQVLEEEGLPVSLQEYVLLTASLATWRGLAGQEEALLRRDMLQRSRASGLGCRLALSLYRHPDAPHLARRLLGALRRLRRDSGEARRSLSDLRRRWHQVRRMLGGGAEAVPS